MLNVCTVKVVPLYRAISRSEGTSCEMHARAGLDADERRMNLGVDGSVG